MVNLIACRLDAQFECAAPGCFTLSKQRVFLIAGATVPQWSLPAGWRVLDGAPLCPEHCVLVQPKDWLIGTPTAAEGLTSAGHAPA